MPPRTDRSPALWIALASLTIGVVAYIAALGQLDDGRDDPAPGASAAAGAPASAARGSRLVSSHLPSRFCRAARQRRAAIFAQVSDARAFEQLGEPRPGEWLWSFREPGQTLDEYARSDYNRKTAARHTLHLQPFGDMTPAQRGLLPVTGEYVSLFFDTRVIALPARALQPGWYARRRQQYDAEAIAADLARRVPPDSLGLIGIAGSDLYALGLNYVFGVGLFTDRAGIYSVQRFGHGHPRARLRRTLQLATHELGHMFSLAHCVFYRCLMNGTNSLAEADRQPLHLCPVCLAKLHHNLRFDPVRRYRQLADFYRRHGLTAEADFAAARAAELSPAGPGR